MKNDTSRNVSLCFERFILEPWNMLSKKTNIKCLNWYKWRKNVFIYSVFSKRVGYFCSKLSGPLHILNIVLLARNLLHNLSFWKKRLGEYPFCISTQLYSSQIRNLIWQLGRFILEREQKKVVPFGQVTPFHFLSRSCKPLLFSPQKLHEKSSINLASCPALQLLIPFWRLGRYLLNL